MSRTERRLVKTPAARAAETASRRRAIVIAAIAVPAALILVAIVLFNNRQVQSASVAATRASLKIGQTAPPFAVATTAGLFDLAKAGGKPTLLEVFATWCPHCQNETAVLDRIYAKYGSKVNVVSVSGAPDNMDRSAPESQADVVAFATKYKATYPIAFDPNLDVAHQYLQGGFPTFVLIGANGTIVAIRDGEIPEADLARALDAVANGRTPDPKMGLKG